MTGLKRRPTTMPDEASIDSFIDGANKDNDGAQELQPPPDNLPWNDPTVRDDVLKLYNLRLPEDYLLKLKYIAEHTPGSMQRFCLDTLLPAIDEAIDDLVK